MNSSSLLHVATIAATLVGLLVASAALFLRGHRRVWLAIGGLSLVFVALAVGVQADIWVHLDIAVARWFGQPAHQVYWLRSVSWGIALLGSPTVTAVAGVLSGILLSWRARSVLPGLIVVATVGAAVLTKTLAKTLVERPRIPAEAAILPRLMGENPFPSGHVVGTATLLGIVAVYAGRGQTRAVRAAAAAVAVGGGLVVALSRLYLGVHWLSDVVGGAVLAGIFVLLGYQVMVVTYRSKRRPVAAGAAAEASVTAVNR